MVGIAVSFTLSLLLSVLLLSFRMAFSHEITYIFLIWNLFLAIIPLGLSTYLRVFRKGHINRLYSLVVAAIWLLFLPNSFYILTDLFHLKQDELIPLWFDLILLLSFAWNGLFLGFASLLDMQQMISEHFRNNRLALRFSAAVIILSSFGIYLGRFFRFNSWDLLTNPATLIADLLQIVMHPIAYKHVWAMTFVYSLALIIFYNM
ncbi:MAG: DUF1361 domain-containing protein, partial [Bacteroidetes bacterium]|nr:DUF1361 domain-containing protein [Bacteroidota bacterium]